MKLDEFPPEPVDQPGVLPSQFRHFGFFFPGFQSIYHTQLIEVIHIYLRQSTFYLMGIGLMVKNIRDVDSRNR
jgi:hypothetical protein